MKLVMIIVMFLLLGAFFIISNEKLSLKDKDSRSKFAVLYYSWFNQLFDHGVKITGYAVNSYWLPGSNETDESLVER